MNAEHQEALKAYAKQYAGIEIAIDARIQSIDSNAMQLEVDGKSIKIYFDHELSDSKDAHRTLVAMLKETSKD